MATATTTNPTVATADSRSFGTRASCSGVFGGNFRENFHGLDEADSLTDRYMLAHADKGRRPRFVGAIEDADHRRLQRDLIR